MSELLLVAVLSGCARPAPPALNTTPERRPFSPLLDGGPVIAGVSYGPYRAGQRPGGLEPSTEELREDLHLIAMQWHMIRIYSSRGPAADILQIIQEDHLPIVVVVGAWIAPDAPTDNAAEVAAAIRLAQAYPEQVAAVSVGNESQVFWSGHRSPPGALVDHIRAVRAAITQPVTTADDYNFWNKPESQAIADEIDFMLLHAYAMWNQQPLDAALDWTAATLARTSSHHPDLPIVLGETGWATELNPEGSEVEHIKAPAGEAEQARFYRAFTAWAEEAQQPYFYFEAFDEPWKGSDDPREVEKHWGLYRVDRSPKPALQE